MINKFPLPTILHEFTAEITKLKPGFIKGMYVTGSLTLNDFHLNKSDIDFLILCNELPKNDLKLFLDTIHKKFDRKFKQPKLSGFYIIPNNLNVRNTQTSKTLCFHEGRMNECSFEMAPVTLYELKTTAITLMGTPAQELNIVVEMNHINKFLFHNINTYWKNWVIKHSSGIGHLLLVLFPRLTEWTILGVARQLYTLKTTKITSKTNAGHYCLRHLPVKYHPILQQAIKIRNENKQHLLSIKQSYYIHPSINRARETIVCANYIIQLFNQAYKDT